MLFYANNQAEVNARPVINMLISHWGKKQAQKGFNKSMAVGTKSYAPF